MLTSIAIDGYLHWLASTRNPSQHTLRAYKSDLKQWLSHVKADPPTSGLADGHVVSFVEAQRSAGLSDLTIIRRLVALREFHTWLVAQQLVTSQSWKFDLFQPSRRHSLPRLAQRDDLRLLHRHLRQKLDESDSLDDAVRRRTPLATTLLIVSLMLSTGIRVGEAATIRQSAIDLADSSIRVRGKGQRDRTVYFTGVWLTGFLTSYLAMREVRDIKHPFLLINQSGNPLTTAAIRLRIKNAASAAGVIRPITPHMLRHAAATQLLEAGVDIRVVQRLLGHASITTTEIYTHVTDTALRRAIGNADILNREFLTDN